MPQLIGHKRERSESDSDEHSQLILEGEDVDDES